ncbi:MAG TPA: branched-chain amino acid ABC transporter permease [Deltaproteobacteria bacterium]|nr:branched-chain amino acid ABC transporter permease [Deltaproteobacteria bacterium]
MIEMIIINGAVMGGVISILATGFSLVFGVAKILNLAYTAFYMVASFLLYIMIIMYKLPLSLSFVTSIIITAILAMASYKICLDRIKEHESAVLIITVALTILFQEILILFFSAINRTIPPLVGGSSEILGVAILNQQIFCVVVSIGIIAIIWLFLSKTKMGNAIMAVAEDREVANLMGINVSRMCMITVGISGVLAGLAAVVVAPLQMIQPYMWMYPLVSVLCAVILGGLGNIKGGIVGAYILGFTEACVVFLFPKFSFLRGAVSLSIMLIILLIRPEGLFGIIFEEERL